MSNLRYPAPARLRRWLPALLPALVLAGASSLAAQSVFKHFITASNGELMDGDAVFRFVSWNIPNLHLVEDNVPFAQENPWRLPDRFEISDALESTRQMGGTVARTYVLSVVRTNDGPGIPRHVRGPGRFDEAAFRALDEVLRTANQAGVRLIVPFVCNWHWWGGRAEYAGFRGKPKEAFWTDPQIIADFKETIRYTLNRTNTLTGVPYREDKAILCWETGNELDATPAWTREIAAWIKSLDPTHLVMDGLNGPRLREDSLTNPEVDIVTTHHYPGGDRSFADLIRENAARAKGRKAYVVGEFGFLDTARMMEAVDAVIESGASGALAWSLRFRNRDGGFYWHSEPSGGNLYKAFHWPGSPLTADYDETAFMAQLRQKAFQIRGLPLPAIPAPAPPRLLPIRSAAAISWQGAVGATGYVVERAAGPDGPWTTLADNVDESSVQYRPLFADESAPAGKWHYRVRARNAAGRSAPSNVVGPVEVSRNTLVDELSDFSKTYQHEGTWTIARRDCRCAKEDAHRAAGASSAALVYRLPSAIHGFQVSAFFPKEVHDPKFLVSEDGRTYRQLSARREIFFQGAGEYGYWKPALYSSAEVLEGAFLRIELTGETQVGRVEVSCAARPNRP